VVDSSGTPLPFTVSGPTAVATVPPGTTTTTLPAGGFGIAPMGLGTAVVTLTIDVTRQNGGTAVRVSDHFAYRPILKNVPTALWGGSVSPDLNGPRFVNDALVGFELTPATPAVPGETAAVRRAALADAEQDVPDAFDWGTAPTFRPDPLADAARAAAVGASITGPAAAAARGRILSALGFPADAFDLAGETGAALADDFLVPPVIAAPGPGIVGGRI
ncbi:MAG TPA: hypothetical protein VD866_08580, partial [Urbifossiella sp.]|nr:hypothetical protein [Urbifossiella sp.]